MSYTLYDATVVLARDSLNSLTAILKKGEAAPNAASLPGARIHDDMKPLTFQVHVACDLSNKVYARMTGQEPPKTEDELKTFADMHARIAQTLQLLAKADREAINKRVGEKVPVGLGPGKEAQISSLGYTNGYALPNIFFHVTTAYNILRKEGVPLGKMDYLKPFLGQYVPDL
ncbi:hypothetical protein CDD83_558 [Cordyceps sp. RAO-2017]|nr:hypothetical protein CDD83_558 [Cordyceps sp. RAO-2017]